MTENVEFDQCIENIGDGQLQINGNKLESNIEFLTQLNIHELIHTQQVGKLSKQCFKFTKIKDFVKILTLSQNKIGNIHGIQCMTQLRVLNLNQNYISDITCIQNLTNLIELDLSYNSIYCIYPIHYLTNLTSLKLHYNSIVDISPLSQLVNLTYLCIRSNLIQDFSPIMLLGILHLKIANQIRCPSKQEMYLCILETTVHKSQYFYRKMLQMSKFTIKSRLKLFEISSRISNIGAHFSERIKSSFAVYGVQNAFQ
ncbi:LPXTG_cell wall anchor domain-containing protein [Hexamita inflata]|uniref:LPXTG cell wall anchor domain-containing protein n=1 Tax=Hexamita inflata TaxID=28002 RepID=A0AA86P9P5_9EUKA|nr:LPXTG cell wall anchor domain-containing protein [Hexamita inflata]